MEILVADTSVLVGLAHVDALAVPPRLAARALVPPAVGEEFGSVPAGFEVRTPADRRLVAALRLRLDAGEAEAIALAAERPDGLLVIDERAGRAVAAELGLWFTRTAGLLVLAKEAGLVGEVGPLLSVLVGAGFRLSDRVVADALARAGEAS